MEDFEDVNTLEDALERLLSHTQYYVPSSDLWAFNLATEALSEKIGKAKEL